MKKRNIVVMVILSIVTAGIYSLYWYCSFQNQLKKETGDGFGGLGHLLITLITGGIYGIYWQYAAGKRLEKLGSTDNAVLYLILSIVALGWLNPFFMQNQANQL